MGTTVIAVTVVMADIMADMITMTTTPATADMTGHRLLATRIAKYNFKMPMIIGLSELRIAHPIIALRVQQQE